MIKDKYDSVARAPKITAPTLALIAADDTLIPPKHAFELIAALTDEQVRAEVVADSNHYTIGNSRRYEAALQAFFGNPGE